MTRHDDSMRLLHTLRSSNSHSKRLPRRPDPTTRQAPLSDLDNPTTCNRRQRRRKQPIARATMRSNCTIFRKACSTRRERRCQRHNCNMGRSTSRKSHGSRRSNTSSTGAASCMACNRANSQHSKHMTKCPLSDSHGRELRLRHCPRSLESHRQHSTTLQDKAYQPVRRRPSSRHLKSLHSIRTPHTRNPLLQHSNLMQCSTLLSQPPIRHTASSLNTQRRSRNSSNSSRRTPSIRSSLAIRPRYVPSSHEPGREICGIHLNTWHASRSIYSAAPKDLVSDGRSEVLHCR